MTKVLVLTGDPIGVRMAGPAIRSWNIARVLSRENEVILATTTMLETVVAPFELRRIQPGDDAQFAELEAWADVIFFQGHAMNQFAGLRTTSKVVVVDIYDPMHLEMLEQGRELARATWELRVSTATRVLNEQLALGDFFLCASERQRLFYLGQLAALGRINPAVYESDPHLSRLLALAPFGVDETAPQHPRDVLRGVVPGIGPDDKVLIWGGGVYSWFDPKSLIRAVAELSKSRPNVRLFFLGTRHPGVEEMGIVRESYDLASELGALNTSVFFNDDWVEYADRGGFLLEADAGVSTHMSHIETTFSFRTRILDYLWASLPIVSTEGDSFAELIEAEGLGLTVAAGDVAALKDALERVLFDEQFAAAARANVERVRQEFFWDRVLEPLVDFVRSPARAADLGDGPRSGVVAALGGGRKPYGLRHDLSMAWHHLRHSGPRVVVSKLANRLRRK